MTRALENSGVKEIFKIYRKRNKKWWELLPLRDDFSLLLAKDKAFWKEYGQDFGWFSSSTPYEIALEEIEHVKRKLDEYRWLYEGTSVFEIPLCKSKVGSWCYWVSIKFYLQDHGLSLQSSSSKF